MARRTKDCRSVPFHGRGQRRSDDAGLVTPETRAALFALLETDPARFLAACKEAQVTSLRQIPVWMELLVTDPWQAAEIAALAEDAGIGHRRL